MKKRIYLIITLALMSFLIAGCGNKVTGNTIVENEGQITIPLSDISTQARFYKYNYNGVNIKYFAVLGSDGKPRTAFDACDVCGGLQGYEQQGSDIACSKCGRVFRIDGLGTQNKGYGCWPSYLPHEVQGDNILIKISDIKNSRKRFI